MQELDSSERGQYSSVFRCENLFYFFCWWWSGGLTCTPGVHFWTSALGPAETQGHTLRSICFILCAWAFCLCMSVPHMSAWYSWRSKESIRSVQGLCAGDAVGRETSELYKLTPDRSRPQQWRLNTVSGCFCWRAHALTSVEVWCALLNWTSRFLFSVMRL